MKVKGIKTLPCPFCGNEAQLTIGQKDIEGQIFQAATCWCVGMKRIPIETWNNRRNEARTRYEKEN